MFKGFLLNQWIQVKSKCQTNKTQMQGAWGVAKLLECSPNIHEAQSMNLSSEQNWTWVHTRTCL